MPLPERIADIKAYQQPHDSVFSRLIYRKISKVLTFYMVKYIPGISAPDITIISFAFGVIGAVGLLTPEWWGRILAFVAIQLSFAFDCSDGEVARMLGRGSKFGIWFDSVSDRAKEIIWFYAIAWQINTTLAWQLATVASLGMLYVGYLREAKKSIFLTERKPEVILRSGLHIGTVDVIVFLLSFGAIFQFNLYVLWLLAIATPFMVLKQLWSTYHQSNKPNRQSVSGI